MKNFFGITAKIAIGFFLAAILSEIMLRIFPTCIAPASAVESSEYAANPLLPNQRVAYSQGWMFQIGNIVEINSAGFHSGTEYERRSDGGAVAFIGDSLVESLLVGSGHLMHPVLEKKFFDAGSDVPVYSLGKSGAGLGDIVNFMRLASERYNVGNFIIKFDRKDILDDIARSGGHFCYVPDGKGGADIKLFAKDAAFGRLRNVAILRYICLNIKLTPGLFASKLKNIFALKGETKAPEANANKSKRLSATEEMLLDAFIKDVLKIAGNDPKRVLFLLRGDDQKEVFASKFSSLGFETLDADAATELKSDLYPPHFYNDLIGTGAV